MKRSRSALTLTLLAVAAAQGCRHGDRRDEVDPSTVGRDMRSYPRGVTIPAAGFGVDLVKRKSMPSAGSIDPEAIPASGANSQ